MLGKQFMIAGYLLAVIIYAEVASYAASRLDSVTIGYSSKRGSYTRTIRSRRSGRRLPGAPN